MVVKLGFLQLVGVSLITYAHENSKNKHQEEAGADKNGLDDEFRVVGILFNVDELLHLRTSLLIIIYFVFCSVFENSNIRWQIQIISWSKKVISFVISAELPTDKGLLHHIGVLQRSEKHIAKMEHWPGQITFPKLGEFH